MTLACMTEVEREIKQLRMKVGIQTASLTAKDKHLKSANQERKQLKTELRTLR